MKSILEAWNEWLSYSSGAKLLGLAAGAILYFLFRQMLAPPGKPGEEATGRRGQILVVYTAVSALLCICPLTAILLQSYTTAHNTYPWLWSAVPLIPCIAYGFAVLLAKERRLLLGLALSAIILLCGSLGIYETGDEPAAEGEYARLSCAALADFLAEQGLPADSVVYAPPVIAEALRQSSGGFRTLYGRDLWEPDLSGYLYDVYPAEYTDLMEWIDFLNGYMYLFDFGGLYYRTNSLGEYTPIDTEGFSPEDYAALDTDPEVALNAYLLCGRALDYGADIILIPLREDCRFDRDALDSVAERLRLRTGSFLVWRENGGEGFYVLYR